MQIDSLPPLREVIANHRLDAQRSLGQNFILDLNLTAKIARLAGVLKGHDILEVGPGPGGLTRGLLTEGARKVVVLEKDSRCLPALKEIARILRPNGQIVIFDRNINALHTKYLIPVRFWKKYAELTGKWMYLKDGQFKERWFSRNYLKSSLRKAGFNFVSHEYVLHNGRSRLLFSYLPKCFRSYSIWVGENKI